MSDLLVHAERKACWTIGEGVLGIVLWLPPTLIVRGLIGIFVAAVVSSACSLAYASDIALWKGGERTICGGKAVTFEESIECYRAVNSRVTTLGKVVDRYTWAEYDYPYYDQSHSILVLMYVEGATGYNGYYLTYLRTASEEEVAFDTEPDAQVGTLASGTCSVEDAPDLTGELLVGNPIDARLGNKLQVERDGAVAGPR